jgi:hypothetical protein
MDNLYIASKFSTLDGNDFANIGFREDEDGI